MSNLFIDTEVEAVVLTVKKKSDSSTLALRFALDFWDLDQIYTGSTYYWPLLVRPPVVQRSVGLAAQNRHETTVELYGNTHFLNYGKSLIDLMDEYQFIGGTAQFYYWTKPRGIAGSNPATALRATKEIVSFDSDPVSGIVRIVTRDSRFKDREVSKRLSSTAHFTDLDENFDGQIGGIALGEATDGNGVIIDAPFIESGIDGSGQPYAKLFGGWVNAANPMHSKTKLFVRNQHKLTDDREWLSVALAANAQTGYSGASGFSAYSTTHRRALSVRDFMYVHSPATDARILTDVRAKVIPLNYRWAAYLDGASDEWLDASGSENWQPNPSNSNSLTFGIWVALTSVAADQVIASVRAGTGTDQSSWVLYYDLAGTCFKFRTYDSAGATLATVSETAHDPVVAGTYYWLQCQIKGSTSKLRIRCNSDTWDEVAWGGTPIQSKAGLRIGASKTGGAITANMNGTIFPAVFFRDAVADSVLDHIYNSASVRKHAAVDPDKLDECEGYWDGDDIIAGTCKDQHGSNDLRIHGGITPVQGSIPTTVTNEDGELKLSVYHVNFNNSTGCYEPTGSPLREATLDMEDGGILSGATVPSFQIEPPLVMNDLESYGFVLSWSNDKDHSKTILANLRAASLALPYYARAKFAHPNSGMFSVTPTLGWQGINSSYDLDMELFCIGEGVESWEDGTTALAPNNFSYQYLEAKEIVVSGTQAQREFNKELEFKLGLSAMEDDGSGTYTGSAGAVVKNPADIIRLLLQGSNLFLNIATGSLNTTKIGNVRASLAAAGFTSMVIPIQEEWSFEELIIEICRQCRILLTQDRDGKLGLHYPIYTGADAMTGINESFLRGEMTLLAYGDEDESNVVNQFKCVYAPDPLNTPKDPAFLRRAGTNSYSGFIELTTAAADVRRAALCTSSQSFFGLREFREAFDFLDSQAMTQRAVDYYCDRYAERQEIAVVRIPKRRFYTTFDVLSTARVNHQGIRSRNGTGFGLHSASSNLGMTWYREGTPCVLWSGGKVAGEVVDVVEEGPFMTLTVQTMSPFAP